MMKSPSEFDATGTGDGGVGSAWPALGGMMKLSGSASAEVTTLVCCASPPVRSKP
jgi:hypothetical protein